MTSRHDPARVPPKLNDAALTSGIHQSKITAKVHKATSDSVNPETFVQLSKAFREQLEQREQIILANAVNVTTDKYAKLTEMFEKGATDLEALIEHTKALAEAQTASPNIGLGQLGGKSDDRTKPHETSDDRTNFVDTSNDQTRHFGASDGRTKLREASDDQTPLCGESNGGTQLCNTSDDRTNFADTSNDQNQHGETSDGRTKLRKASDNQTQLCEKSNGGIQFCNTSDDWTNFADTSNDQTRHGGTSDGQTKLGETSGDRTELAGAPNDQTKIGETLAELSQLCKELDSLDDEQSESDRTEPVTKVGLPDVSDKSKSQKVTDSNSETRDQKLRTAVTSASSFQTDVLKEASPEDTNDTKQENAELCNTTLSDSAPEQNQTSVDAVEGSASQKIGKRARRKQIDLVVAQFAEQEMMKSALAKLRSYQETAAMKKALAEYRAELLAGRGSFRRNQQALLAKNRDEYTRQLNKLTPFDRCVCISFKGPIKGSRNKKLAESATRFAKHRAAVHRTRNDTVATTQWEILSWDVSGDLMEDLQWLNTFFTTFKMGDNEKLHFDQVYRDIVFNHQKDLAMDLPISLITIRDPSLNADDLKTFIARRQTWINTEDACDGTAFNALSNSEKDLVATQSDADVFDPLCARLHWLTVACELKNCPRKDLRDLMPKAECLAGIPSTVIGRDVGCLQLITDYTQEDFRSYQEARLLICCRYIQLAFNLPLPHVHVPRSI